MRLIQEASKVCVIIAAKNAERSIARAVSSALAQPEAAEVIVVDDGSTDRTADVALSQDDGRGRLRVLVSPHNEGPSAARNRAIEASTSPILCILDADDYLQAGRIGRLLELGGSDWEFLADNLLVVEEGREEGPFEPMLEPELSAGAALDLAAFVGGCISRPDRHRRELGFLKPLMRRSFLDASRLRYDPSMRLGEDYALYCAALAARARFLLVGVCGYVVVRRQDSLSIRHGVDDLAGVLRTDLRLLARTDLSEAARAALREHHRTTRLNYDFRRVLDAKRSRQWGTMLHHLLRNPATTLHILRETRRGKRRTREASRSASRSVWPQETRPLKAVGGGPG